MTAVRAPGTWSCSCELLAEDDSVVEWVSLALPTNRFWRNVARKRDTPTSIAGFASRDAVEGRPNGRSRQLLKRLIPPPGSPSNTHGDDRVAEGVGAGVVESAADAMLLDFGDPFEPLL